MKIIKGNLFVIFENCLFCLMAVLKKNSELPNTVGFYSSILHELYSTYKKRKAQLTGGVQY